MDLATLVKRISLSLILLLILSTLSCSPQTPGQVKFGVDADYFAGLRMLKEGKEKAARAKFTKCVKKGSYYIAKKSAENLCSFGNLQERNHAALDLVKKYDEKDSLLIAVNQLNSSDEISKVLELTQNLNFKEDKDELIKIRLECLKKLKSEKYENEVYEWFTSCRISQLHYQFYRNTYKHPDFINIGNEDENPDITYTPQQFAINYRIELYKRNYTYTFENAEKIIGYMKDGILPASAMLASDIGKSYLYGSMEFEKNAAYFNSLAEYFNDTDMAYYFYFYAGRLYDKADYFYTQTQKAFEEAYEIADSNEQKDNALWYLINCSQKVSIDSIITNIEKYCTEWDDPDYFDDIFEMLITSLLASGNWDAFYDIYTKIDTYASNEIVAQFAYIYARLAEEGLAQGDKKSIENAYKRALDADSSAYYKVMSCYRLGLNQDDVREVLTRPYKRNLNSKNNDKDKEKIKSAQKLLEGYAYFGFPEYIYPSWLELYKNGLPTDTYFYLADFLKQVADNSKDKTYYTQALKIASRGQSQSERPLSMEELKLVYPRDFSDLIEKYSQEYKINSNIIYALIRSESFFDPDVSSTAGAIGLSQLMEFTASDMAKKLKLKEYSLTDPEDSIKIGAYYLAELIERCENNELLAFCSYNAGITKVRRWVKSSILGFGKKSNLPLDIFLETIPYSETRGYGRKLISATAMYEYLECPENFTSIVKDLMKE